jgi:potassium efflux system protein
MIRTLLVVLALVLWLPFAAGAQSNTLSDAYYEEWERVAQRAEEAVEANRASSDAFEVLRSELVVYRSEFQKAQSTNAARIETVERQLAALGPAPTDGSVEDPEIAARRAALQAQLASLRAPVIRAEEAYLRADGLISEIDTILRERQTEGLLQIGPSPLAPKNLMEAWAALQNWAHDLWREVKRVFTSPSQRALLLKRLPLVITLIVVGALALLRAQPWSRRVAAAIILRSNRELHWLIKTLLSGAGAIIAVLGVLAIASAFLSAGLVAPRIDAVMTTVMWMAAWIWGSVWLGHVLFPDVLLGKPFLSISAKESPAARHALLGIGISAAVFELAELVTARPGLSEGANAVIQAVPVVLGGIFIARLGRVMAGMVRTEKPETDEDIALDYRDHFVAGAGRVLTLLSLAGIVLALAGYGVGARALIYPLILSLALLGGILVLHRVLTDIYRVILINGTSQEEGSDQQPSEGLVPVLLGIGLTLVSLPLFALAWGAREADLTELWQRFVSGVSFGGIRVSPGSLLTFIVVFMIGYVATRMVQGTLRNSVLPKTRLDVGGRTAVVSGVGYIGLFLAAVVAITAAGIDLSSLAIVAGALSVGIGFGMQTIASNFVSGLILLVERPVSEGDWIEIGGVMGTVRRISVRSTTIETFDRTDVIVPNADLISGQVTNWTKSSLTGRLIVPVGVAYGTDTRRVQTILQEIAEAHPIVIVNPPPMIVFAGFGADSLDFELRMILRDVNQMLRVKTEVNHLIAARFEAEGIEIPFAQRDLWLRNPEALSGVPASGPVAPTDTSQEALGPLGEGYDDEQGDDAAEPEDPR